MSLPLLDRGQQKAQVVDWARLIPGETQAFRGAGKKPVQAVRVCAPEKVAEIETRAVVRASETTLAMLIPGPLQNRMAWRWLRATAADFALVILNWLLIGALLVPLRMLFPWVRSFGFAAGAPVSLVGIALLHGALITLIGYSEGLHTGVGNLPRQVRILGKSSLLATSLMCITFGLQGAPWTVCALFCGAGFLHFGALWAWRWQSASQSGSAQRSAEVRNVLIVGAGGVGRRMAAYVGGHPEAGRTVCGFLDNDRPLGNGVIGRVSDLAQMARTGFVDEVILAAPHDRSLTVQVVREAQRLRLDVEIVPEFVRL